MDGGNYEKVIMEPKRAGGTRFEHANPILSVANMARSLQYYLEVLVSAMPSGAARTSRA
jgi:hypothetical protein